jgi:myo-inositol-1(or 4)-monophosphatase
VGPRQVSGADHAAAACRFVYASEEAEPEVIGDDSDPDLCVLVDPLDTSEPAVRALHGYTHVLVYSRALRRPVAAVVGDIYHHVQLYLAARHDDGTDRASFVTRDALSRPSPDGSKRGRIGVDFGSVSLCHVAAGFTNATVEFAKGFAIWDLAPGHYITTALS